MDFVPIDRVIRPSLQFAGVFAVEFLNIQILNDGIVEEDEQFLVRAVGTTPVRMSSFMEVTIVIRDTDIAGES